MSTELTITEDQQNWTPQQQAALVQIGVDRATEGDLSVFFHQCQRTGLDPFARQIYMIGRNTRVKVWNQQTGREEWQNATKYTIQTGIDGFRLIARRAVDARGEALSISQVLFVGEDGQWVDYWAFQQPPIAAKVKVSRAGGEFVAVAMFNEYAARDRNGQITKMWADKPALMIGKCAEALALRKAFPLDLSGLYTAEEMEQAGPEASPLMVDVKGVEILQGLMERLAMDTAAQGRHIAYVSKGRTSTLSELYQEQAIQLRDNLVNELQKREAAAQEAAEPIVEAEVVELVTVTEEQLDYLKQWFDALHMDEASVSQTMLEISGGRTNSPEGLSVDEAREWMMAMAAKQQRGEL